MKTIILILVVLSVSLTLKAQTQKGDQLIGGYINFGISKGTFNSNYDNNNSTGTIFSIGPTYSYFIANNIDLAGTTTYSYQKITYNLLNDAPAVQGQNFNSNIFSAAIYLRKYFLYNNKIGIRTGPYFQYMEFKIQGFYTDPTDNNLSNEHVINAGVGLDLVYFPTKTLGLSANLGSLSYSHYEFAEASEHANSNSFGLNLIGSSLGISAFYCF